jgi:PAS domain-containing protein
LGAEAQEVLDGLRGVLSGSQDQFKHEYDCHSPTEQRWFTMHVSPLNRPDGGAVIAQINITDLKRAEAQIVQINATLEQRVLERTAELQLERSKLSATFENMAMGVVICNPQGGEIVMNAAALRMHGFASREDQNTRIADYADDWELRDAAGRVLPFAGWPLPRAIAGDFCRDWEVHLRHIKSQHERDCSYTSVPVRNDAGEIRLLVMTLLDITERKRVMEEIRKLNTELEERVCQRTAALSAANQELAAFNRVMVDREQRIIGMKEEVNALCLELGRAVEYPPVWEEESK